MLRLGLTFAISIAALNAQRVDLTLDDSEAEAALAILENQPKHQIVAEADWARLFAAEPYRRLKAREASVDSPLADEVFKSFLLSPSMLAQEARLRAALQLWRQADLNLLGERVLEYLPKGARIQAKVYPEIKPGTNSFVWGSDSDRAIFVYLDPALSRAQFENKIAHECHHIGLESLNQRQEAILKALPDAQQKAIRWLGGFGEGEAMLAAAGSPEIHPHAADDAEARAAWDAGMARFDVDLAAVQRFLLDILDAEIRAPREIQRRAQPFYGQQGAWYTVGYRMASLVEKRFGRQALVGGMLDPRKLLELYNRAAGQDRSLPQWSPELLAKLNRR